MQNATTPAERHRQHMEAKGQSVADPKAGEVSGDLSDPERRALAEMQENERVNSTPGVQPGRDFRTPQQKAALDNHIETKRAAGLTGEADKTVDPNTHVFDPPTPEKLAKASEPIKPSELDGSVQNREGKLATDPKDRSNLPDSIVQNQAGPSVENGAGEQEVADEK